MTAAELVAEEVRAFLDLAWDPELPLLDWRGTLVDSGWGAPSWPVELYGRDLASELNRVVSAVFAEVGAIGVAAGSGVTLAAPTILAHASAPVQRRLLRRILTGEDKWCQLFSEPGSGSDLAGLTTRAVRDGDEWVVNGQKVWTTGAATAAYGMLLARTDWDAPKHRGITYFALPMQQPGVEVRPLRQMNGYASFNEVFLTDARVSAEDVIGEPGDGWAAALTTLSHERGLAAAVRGHAVPAGGGRTAREAAEEAAAYAKTYEWYPQRAGRADLVVPLAQERGLADDRLVRQQTAALIAFERAAGWNVDRSKAARVGGKPPGPEGSLAKLCGSEIARRSAAAHTRLAGPAGMLGGSCSPAEGIVGEVLVSVPGASIAGGTDEVQRNIVGERVLGLPKEPSVDSGVAFRTVRTNAGRPTR